MSVVSSTERAGARTAPTLRVGIIGAGNIARNHVQGYRAAGAEVIAIADTMPQVLARRAREWGVEHAFTDVGELLSLPGLDAVSVCTPNAAHHAATLAAAAASVHVLCEKPISLSLAEADEMIEACRRAGIVLAIDHHLRANPAVVRARAMIEDGAIGRITFVGLRQAHDWGGAAEVPVGFRTPTMAGGGTLLDNGCHLFDLARHLAGPVSEVFARTATLGFEIEVEDTAVVSLRFASGALGSLETSWTSTGWDQGFTVNGTRGSLEYTERQGRPVLRHVHREPGDRDFGSATVTSWEHAGDGDHTRAVAAFVAAVRGERPVACSGEDGREAVRLALASYQSAASGLPVAIEA
ncbi:MAG: Gfo/Idh/MocA family oxidoreductase [Candidatus Limnocylindrales bacterium]